MEIQAVSVTLDRDDDARQGGWVGGDFLEYLLDEEYGATPEYLSVALVITFEPETPPDVIDAVVARCGGRIRPGHTPHYVCVGFDDRETALRAAACYDFASEVAVCLPNEYLSLDE